MNLTDGLNDEQAQAVLSESERILMLAGAGTGKTRTLTHRLAHLNLNCRVGVSSILAITFTRAAAKEMKDRLIPLIGDEAKKLICCTFHALAVRILQEWGHRIGLNRSFTIYSQEDREDVLKSIIDTSEYRTTYGKMKKANWSFSSNSPEEAVWREYQWQLKRFNAVDLDNLIAKVIELFTKHSDIVERYRKLWKYVFVDEFQDTNIEQLQLIKMLDPVNLFGIGDDFQTIYSFNGARVENILEFPSDFPGTEVIKLERNYRSTKPIIEAANNLISFNENQTKKKLLTVKDGPQIKEEIYMDASAETLGIVNEILNKVTNEPYSNYAVLARTNSQVETVHRALREAKVPSMILSGSDDPLKRTDIKSLIAFMDWSLNPLDEMSFKRVLGFPERKLTESQIQQAEKVAIEQSVELWRALIASSDQSVYQYASDLHRLAECVRESAFASDIFPLLADRLKLNEYYTERSLHNRIEELKKAITYVLFWVERQQKNGEDFSPSAFLKWVKIRDIQEKLMENRDAVKLMTIHGSKGLEFSTVFLIGMNEDVFPHRNTTNMEEERRLAFVGVTRAKDRLIISSVKTTTKWGKVENVLPSRFISEMKEALKC